MLFLEGLFRLLLPPASQEHVLGDLREECKSPREYLVAGISVLGPVIVSRIRRTTDLQVFVMEALAVYLSFSAAAWWLGREAFLYDHGGFVRLAIPTMVTVIGLLLCNAYADPKKPSSWKRPILQSAGSIGVAFLGQGILFDTRPSFAVPFGIVACGSCASLVLVSTLRMLFPTILNNPSKGLLLNKAHISKLEFIPLSWPIQEIRQKIGRVSFPFRGKTGVTCAIALLIGVSLWTMDGEVLTPRWAVRALIVVLVIIAIGLRG